ncbi:MAG: endonuclease/exonuclease/phosphatase [Chitinophagaceae bacterium BSSC1]|nr:MAG: endonuclease/exonuclease/phosphatase [Chitinophagaceae bacterium BSSC1]
MIVWLLLIGYHSLLAQSKTGLSKIAVLAFYNLENFYDTKDNGLVDDNEFTALGAKHYNEGIYQNKILHLATVIKEIGEQFTKDGAALLGVVEIENDTVLQDLVSHPLLRSRKYQIVHYDSKDKRGIDVALLYNPKYFKPIHSTSIHVNLPSSTGVKYETRDILMVHGLLDGDSIYLFVNHWPSKRGGEDKTTASRNAAAATCRNEIDRIQSKEPRAKILVMGDFNDNPDSYSISTILKTSGNAQRLNPGFLFNPWLKIFKQGRGTLANQDVWSLFDQVLISSFWLSNEQTGFHFKYALIHQTNAMVENSGRYRGYPMRTWDGNNYRGGFSDHFPSYIVVLKPLQPEIDH